MALPRAHVLTITHVPERWDGVVGAGWRGVEQSRRCGRSRLGGKAEPMGPQATIGGLAGAAVGWRGAFFFEFFLELGLNGTLLSQKI